MIYLYRYSMIMRISTNFPLYFLITISQVAKKIRHQSLKNNSTFIRTARRQCNKNIFFSIVILNKLCHLIDWEKCKQPILPISGQNLFKIMLTMSMFSLRNSPQIALVTQKSYIKSNKATLTSSLKTADCIIRRLLSPPAISSKSMTARTFSRRFLTKRIFTSASNSAAHICFSIEFKT